MDILNTYTYNDSAWALLQFFSVVGMIAFVVFFIGSLIYDTEKWKQHVFVALLLIISIIAFNYSCDLISKDNKTRHDVVINDMSKFDTNKYKIIEQKGKLITIEEIK